MLGIEHAKNKMVGPRRAARHCAPSQGSTCLDDGDGISNDELDACAKAQGVEIRRGDFVLVRTGQMERCLEEGNGAAMPAAMRRA